MPCHCPSAGRPAVTGIDRDTAVSAALMCAGMSSAPSVVCVSHCIEGSSDDGTNLRKNSSRSRRTSGSAFSWMHSEHEVCWTNSVNNPCSTPVSRTNRTTSAVNSCSPGPEVWIVRTACIRGHRHASTRRIQYRSRHRELARPVAAVLWQLVGDVPHPAVIEDVRRCRRQRALVDEVPCRNEGQCHERQDRQRSDRRLAAGGTDPAPDRGRGPIALELNDVGPRQGDAVAPPCGDIRKRLTVERLADPAVAIRSGSAERP